MSRLSDQVSSLDKMIKMLLDDVGKGKTTAEDALVRFQRARQELVNITSSHPPTKRPDAN